jgi:hypothetical protein
MAELNELWEERAALMEYDGGLSRAEAEAQAWACVGGASAPGGDISTSPPADQPPLQGLTLPPPQEAPRRSRRDARQ